MSILPGLRILVIMAACAAVAQGKVVYVSTTGSDANDGLSWGTAKKTVQAGLNAATAGDQVWVAAGTYVECITLTLGVELYGGFAGGETDLSQRDSRTNGTILDGNQGGGVVRALSNATASTRIDGFTIRNGKASSGGGIYCYAFSSPTIANNTITGNTSVYGGGIDCDSSSTPTITNNTIAGNTAGYGGGIGCSSSSWPAIANNTISDNMASLYGGGIYCFSCSPAITNNTITDNTAGSNANNGSGGGIYCYSSSPAITYNTIAGNTASYSGGGIYCYSFSSPTIANNSIAGNSGYGVDCESSSPLIANNTVISNSGGIYSYSSSPTIINTIIVFNATGVCVSSGTPTLCCCCVYGNVGYNYYGITDPTGTNGNISADPQLADVARSNPHLQPTSPCIDTGDDTAVQAGWTDIDGQARVHGKHVDIGADESDGTVWPAAAGIVYVSPSGDDSNNGLSWGSAKRTVQAGIDAGGSGSQVWVAAGTYVGTIQLRFGVALYGGFVGGETDLSQRNWRTNLTILDGNQAGTVVTAPPAAPASTRIDGFTIRNGKTSSSYDAGGIYCGYSSPTIINNTIIGNTATDGHGGGIYCEYACPTINNNIITGNTASFGGGIYCWYYSCPTVANNVITGNTASENGGGICCQAFSSPTITNNTITGNTASSYGGGICCQSCSPAITNNTISGNTASYSGGGGIYCSGSSSAITNTIIAFNSSGIYRDSHSSSTPTLGYCCVYGNTSYNYSGIANPSGHNGNISANPLFVQTPSAGPDGKWATADDLPGDLHLAAGSPCINAGDPAYVPVAGATDMDGQPRVIGGRVDIGADEYCLAGDANFDGHVNVGDLQLLIQSWAAQQGDVNYNPAVDFNGDGFVNVADLQVLVSNWRRSS